jgi:cytosine/adenosine deaminase-related metal-dependent hydrolase
MRAALYQIRASRQSASVLSAFDVLRMHTLGSAEVLGVGRSVRCGRCLTFSEGS